MKKTGSWASEESFVISAGGTTAYTSPTLTNSETRTLEVCLPSSTNSQYSLEMKDSYGDSWTDGGWIELYGINGNMAFKGMMVESRTETHLFSLYSPINKNEDWKYATGAQASGNWKDFNYSDASWTLITLGSATQTASGTQYFRKTFAGITGMAAIDLQLNYRAGVVAYINGVEVFRDNMPEGAVVDTTPAQGSYAFYAYHGVVRPAYVAEATQAVLAVELHFTQTTEETIQFNGFLAYNAPDMQGSTCFVMPYAVSATSSDSSNAASAFSWTRTSYASGYTTSIYTTEFTGNVIPIVNSIRIWPYNNPSNHPNMFTISGAFTASGPWNTILQGKSVSYTTNTWKQVDAALPGKRYPFLRISNMESQNTLYLNELQYLICNRAPSTVITYPEQTYSFYANYEAIEIESDLFGLTGCQVTPSLPNGVSIDGGCKITGTSTSVAVATTYTVTAQYDGSQMTGTVNIAFNECSGGFYKILRTYKSNPQTEYFRIRDSSNDNIIFEVPSGHSHEANKDWVKYLCITVERFDISVYDPSYWITGSYLYLYLMLPNNEQELVTKMRYDSYQSNEHNHYLRTPSISPKSNWYYNMNTVPDNWYSDTSSAWQTGSMGNFPAATNRVQLYRQTFTISSMNDVIGVILSLRYRYGCVVYLNGHEVYRKGVVGEVSATSTVSSTYQDLMYRVVTLPAKTIQMEGSPAVQYLQSGSNTIAIAIIASSDSQTQSYFDAIVTLMPSTATSHIWEFTGSMTGITGTFSNPFDMNHGTTISGSSCDNNSLTISLSNDRREWVTSVHIQSYYDGLTDLPTKFKLSARNLEDEDWTVLTDVSNLAFTLVGQKNRIYFHNNKSYNQFKFENFGTGDSSACAWKVQSLDLYADDTVTEPTTLTYPSSVTVYKNIEMSEVMPEGNRFFNYRITPVLPAGIQFNPNNGWISGTPTVESPQTVYTITATKLTGGDITVTLQLAVTICTNGQGLITVRIRTDSYPNECSWKLFSGKTVSGEPLQYVSPYPMKNSYYYLDFCKPDGLYTFQAFDSFGDGWQPGTGYTLTVDMGEMEIEMEELTSGSPKPLSVSTYFSTYIPFQIEYTDWKVYQQQAPEGWNTVSFDDSAWTTCKAANIQRTDMVTTYIRKTFQLTSIDDYPVMNVRVKYSGGLVAYLNGNKVARFNLDEFFDATTESIAEHDSSVFSKFHIILSTAGVVEGMNVIAFEVHRAMGGSTSDPVVFDATGVFGVNDCSAVVDSYAELSSSTPTSGTIADMMNLNPATSVTLPNVVDTFVQWTVENLEGSKWNSFNMMLNVALYSFGFDIQSTFEQDNSTIITTFTGLSITDRKKPQIEVPVALAGFRTFKYSITNPSNLPGYSSMHTTYCKASGAVCPGIESYPPVGEGQESPSRCPDGYSGYSYRLCSSGQLGEVKLDKCQMRLPAAFHYDRARYQFVKDTVSTTGAPMYRYIVKRFYMDSNTLPEGLTLDEQTGEIKGTPVDTADLTTYTIYAENDSGATRTTVVISVRKGQCKAEGVFPVTDVGVVAEYQCSMQGNYVGSQKRACVLGETDGEWQKASGFCMPVFGIVLLVIVVILVIGVVVFLLMRSGKKAKAVGGVKSKKSTKGGSVKSTKGSTKNVKV